MRLLSIRGSMDFNYDDCILKVEDSGSIICNSINNVEEFLACYPTEEVAMIALKLVHDAYENGEKVFRFPLTKEVIEYGHMNGLIKNKNNPPVSGGEWE